MRLRIESMEHNYLSVGYREAKYVILAHIVQEIVWLPELSAIEEQPSFIRGIFNLRGHIVPVVDLGMRFGYGSEKHLLEHRVVVIENNARRVGILVHELIDLVAVEDEAIEEVDRYQLPGSEAKYIRGVVKQEDSLYLLLNFEALLNDAAEAVLDHSATPESKPSDAEAAIFHNRALELALVPEDEDVSDHADFALVRLGGELFGLAVEIVHEFIHLPELTPIPCSPSHIAGNMNLRGDILTVIDIRTLLGLQAQQAATEIVVLQVDDNVFGIVVEAIDDVVSFSAGTMTSVDQVNADGTAGWCSGTAKRGEQVVSLIDMRRLLPQLQPRTASSLPSTINL